MKKLLTAYEMQKHLRVVEDYIDNFLNFESPYIRACAKHIFHAGGKRLRPAFVMLSAKYFGDDHALKQVLPVAAAMELIHMASLIHDDINDHAATRRGKPTLNALHGNAAALHIGDYILSKAIALIDEQPRGQELIPILGHTAAEMSKGEVAQIFSMFDLEQRVEDYYYRIERKTALLIANCCQIGATLVQDNQQYIDAFYQYGFHLGMAFQIKDDLLDMLESEVAIGKPVGNDLASGLMTLPTILVLQKDFPEKSTLVALIKEKFPNGRTDVNTALQIIGAQDGYVEANGYIEKHIVKAKEYLDTLPAHRLQKLLVQGADYVGDRAL